MHRASIVKKLCLSIVAVTLLLAVIFGYMLHFNTSQFAWHKTEESLEFIAQIADTAFIRLMSDIDGVARVISFNKTTSDFLAENLPDMLYRSTAVTYSRYIDNLLSANENFNALMLYNASGEKVIHSGVGVSTVYFEEHLDPEIAHLLNGKTSQQVWRHKEADWDGRNTICMMRIYKNLFNPETLEYLGAMEVNVPASAILASQGLQSGFSYQMFFVSNDNELLWGAFTPEQHHTYLELVENGVPETSFYSNDGAFFTYVLPSATGQGNLFITIPTHDFSAQNQEILMQLLLLMILMAICIILALITLSHTVLRPLLTLSKLVDSFQPETLEYDDPSGKMLQLANRRDEVGRLSQSFTNLIDKTRQCVINIEQANSTKRHLELELLMSQIKPHFLYNTIEIICGMAVLGKNDEIFQTAKMLGTFYRLNLSGGARMITVAKELTHAESYMEIIHLRNPQQFEYQIDCDDGILGVSILRMLLQPVVENSLMHGIAGMESGGLIRIEARSEGENDLLLTVQDNGVGMSREKIESIFNSPTPSAHGFGLKNVDERIKLHYGPAYGLQIESEPNKGTRVLIRVRKDQN